ncbi:MAG: HAD-IIIC family phosphatase [Propionivibrio sp.]
MSTNNPLTFETAMRRYEAQETLFASRPSRLDLLRVNLPAQAFEEATIVNVWRNHSFEPLQPLIAYYAAFRAWSLSFRLGSYDDSFSFHGIQSASLELLWMDSRRLLDRIAFPEWLEWLKERVTALRRLSSAPIILATWLTDEAQRMSLRTILEEVPAVFFADLTEVCEAVGVPLLDDRSAALAGTPISGSAQVVLARTLACKWLAGAALPPIKALALDLDNTLHAGVLGEDGIESVVLTPNHENLQRFVKQLQQRGVFIALVSRNEQADVQALFSRRNDYPLRWDDFSVTEVSWGDKADALQRIARTLRISTDAILFVDDNPGELAAVTQRLTRLQTLYADPCAELTRLAIEYYPGLWRWKQEADDAKRILDLKATTERDSLALIYNDPAEYLRSLKVTLSYFWDAQPQLGRLSDLCRKTNQFNLALRRFSEAELADRMKRADTCVASVQLSDRLSDSGIIAVIVAERSGSELRVEELCISCRAMGRHLENDIVIHALRRMPIWADCKNVVFRVRHGERNQPSLDWLNRLLKTSAFTLPSDESCAVTAEVLENLKPMQGIVLANGE